MQQNHSGSDRNDTRKINTVIDLLYLLGWVVLGPVLGFGCIFAIGPAVIADIIFCWRKRRDLRKELVSSSRPTAIHVVKRRNSNGKFFVTIGYKMDTTSYTSKNEKTVSEGIYNLPDNCSTPKLVVFDRHTSLRWKNGYFLGNVSSRHPASGPFYSPAVLALDDDDSFCAAVCRFPFFLLVTAFVTFVMGTIVGARTVVAYFVTAGVLMLIGVLVALYLHFHWRNATLNACQIVDELPARAMDDDHEHVGELEMGMHVVRVEDDADITDECGLI